MKIDIHKGSTLFFIYPLRTFWLIFRYLSLSLLILCGCFSSVAWATDASLSGNNVSATLKLIGSLATGGGTVIDTANDFAYIMTNSNVKIIDISDPTNPTLVATYSGIVSGRGLTVEGNYVYVADGNGDLKILDVSTPSNPTLAGSEGALGIGTPIDVTVAGNIAYVSGASGVALIDISTPSNPIFLGKEVSNNGTSEEVQVIGNTMYKAAPSYDLQVFDVSNSSNPTLQTTITLSSGTAQGVTVIGTTAYIAARTAGLWIIDISDLNNPQEIGQYDTDGQVFNMVVRDNYAYLVDSGEGIKILDISVPTNPVLVSASDEGSNDLSVFESKIYSVASDLKVFDPNYYTGVTPENTPYTLSLELGALYNAIPNSNVTFSSDNTGLIANNAITLTGSGSTRTLTLTPTSNQTGTAVITITVTDGSNTMILTLEMTVVPFVIINEVDAMLSTDEEFIELYDGGVGNTALDGYVIVLFDGATDQSYQSFDLDAKSTDANGYFLLGNSSVTSVDLTFSSNTIKDDANAIALYWADATDFPFNTPVTTANLLDAIVYDTDDADDTELLTLLNGGQPQVNEAGGGDAANESNQRCANGSGGLRNTSTYIQTTATPKADNNCPVNTQPTTTGITDVVVDEDAANTVIDLLTSFADAEDGAAGLTYTVANNDNTGLFTTTNIAGSNLTLDYADNANGIANLTIRATDTGGLFIEDTFKITVNAVNDAPSFTKGPNQTIIADGNPDIISNWATGFIAGPTNESTQSLSAYQVTVTSNAGIFLVSPTIDTGGHLNFTPVSNIGVATTATIEVRVKDDGGTPNGGEDTSSVQTFTITVNPNAANTSPTTTGISDITVDEDAANTVIDLSTSFADTEDGAAGLTYTIANNDNTGLFTTTNIAGSNLTLDYADNANGSANLTIRATDTGSLFIEDTFTVTINAVNDAPSFTKGANQTVTAGEGSQTVTNWATGFSVGPNNESTQTLKEYQVTVTSNTGIFQVTPTIDTSGRLTYTPVTRINSTTTATIKVVVLDDGGTSNSGEDTSAEQTFTITVKPAESESTNSNTDSMQPLSPTMDLFLEFKGEGTGQIISELHGIDCHSDDESCQYTIETATQVELTAIAEKGSQFKAWNGHSDCSDGQLFMTSNLLCSAYFELLPTPAINLSTTTLNITEGDTISYRLWLNTAPSQLVTVSFNTDDELILEPASLTFDSQNWQNPQMVTVVNVENEVVDGDRQHLISHSVISDDTQYHNLVADNVEVNITDDDVVDNEVTNMPPVLTQKIPLNEPSQSTNTTSSSNEKVVTSNNNIPPFSDEKVQTPETPVEPTVLPNNQVSMTLTDRTQTIVESSNENGVPENEVPSVESIATKPVNTEIPSDILPVEPMTTMPEEPVEIELVETNQPSMPVEPVEIELVETNQPSIAEPYIMPPCHNREGWLDGVVWMDWVCNAQGATINSDLVEIRENGHLSHFKLKSTLFNQGWISQATIEETGQVVGGIVTGLINNHGTMKDFEFLGHWIKGGTIAGDVLLTGELAGHRILVDSFFQDVQLAPNTRIRGTQINGQIIGKLVGRIEGNVDYPASLDTLKIQAGSHLKNVKIGKEVAIGNHVSFTDVQFNDTWVENCTLAGDIQNTHAGHFRNIKLATNTSIHGGQWMGSIEGDAIAPALIESATIMAGSQLSHVVIGHEVQLADNVIIGDGVSFLVQPEEPDQADDTIDLPTLSDSTAINAQGETISTLTQFKCGISIDDSSTYQQRVTTRTTNNVVIEGHLLIEAKDIGLPVETIVVAGVTLPNAHEPIYYMLDSQGHPSYWDGNLSNLVAFRAKHHLTAIQPIFIWEGQIAVIGTIELYFGYRKPDGTIVFSTLAMTLTE